MKKRVFVVLLVCLLALVVSSCATDLAPDWSNRWYVNPMEPGRHDYTILGPVVVEGTWTGILGGTLDLGMGAPMSFYVFQRGGINHIDVLTAAQRQYPTANAVININVSSVQNIYPFFSNRQLTVTGMAVRFADVQNNSRR